MDMRPLQSSSVSEMHAKGIYYYNTETSLERPSNTSLPSVLPYLVLRVKKHSMFVLGMDQITIKTTNPKGSHFLKTDL
jgi:hypothetical protein